jgi:hypothetical protein
MFDMLESFVSNLEVLKLLVPRLRAEGKVRGFKGNKGVWLTDSEVQICEHLLRVLRPCKNVTTVLQGKRFVTASTAGPLVKTCGAQATAISEELPEDSPVRDVATALAKAVSDRFADTHKHEIIAHILDPRFKRPVDDYLAAAWQELGSQFGLEVQLVALEQQQQQQQAADKKEREEKEKAEKQKQKAKAKDGKVEKKVAAAKPEAATSQPTTFQPAVEDLVRIFGLGLAETEQPKRDPYNELNEYLLKEPVLGIREDPLKWWRDNRSRYPVLERLARKYLCIQATSVPTERVWSTAGNVLTARRSSLHPLNLECLVLIHENYGALRGLYEIDSKLLDTVHNELMRKQEEKKA